MSDNPDQPSFPTGGALDVFADLAREDNDPLLGRTLGDYEIIGLIATGGMGRVYRARRADGSFDREVAVEVSADSSLSDELRLRFAQEQNVLAGLNHPNICQLYDAQVTDEGWPYIVMELVDGDSIVDYCEKGALDARERMRLLVDVVDAVAYAHSQLVVHRDIKPANVLVSSNNQVKLLDFGIAKLLESDAGLTRATPFTPRYASPEQLLGKPITVASDIAQLGLLIYEVLIGQPLNPDETLASAIQRAADGRSLRVDAELGHDLPQEVLSIIEQCLRSDPGDRYSDANRLKADIEAWLAGYPVTAAGQSNAYRFRKLVARNLPMAVTLAVAMTAIVSGVAWYTWQLGIARQMAEEQAAAAELEAEKANQVSQFLIRLFDAPDPQYARGADVTVREVLESGVDEIRSELDGQDDLKAGLLITLGRVYNELGELEKAGELLEEAVEVLRDFETDDTTRLAVAIFTHAQHVSTLGDLARAIEMFEEALEIARQTDTEKSTRRQIAFLNSLGVMNSRLNRFDDARASYQQSIALSSEVYGPDHVETSVSKANLGTLLHKLGNADEALPLLESAYAIAMEEHGPYHPWIAPRAINLGRVYQTLGRIDEAEALQRVALDQDRHIYGESHHYVASSLRSLGALLYHEKGSNEGIELIEQALAMEIETLGSEHIDTNDTRNLLGLYYTEVGRYAEAERLLDESRAVLPAVLDDDHVYLADLAAHRGRLYLETDRPVEAVEALTEGIAMYKRLFGEDTERITEPARWLADARAAVGE